jgi:hypothetical protein
LEKKEYFQSYGKKTLSNQPLGRVAPSCDKIQKFNTNTSAILKKVHKQKPDGIYGVLGQHFNV